MTSPTELYSLLRWVLLRCDLSHRAVLFVKVDTSMLVTSPTELYSLLRWVLLACDFSHRAVQFVKVGTSTL